MDKIRVGIDNILKSDDVSDLFNGIDKKLELDLCEINDISNHSLSEKMIDLLILPLKKVPTTLPDRLVIAGLTPRNHHKEVLYIRPDAIDKKKPLKLKEQSIIGTQDQRQLIQLRSLRNDLNIKAYQFDVTHFLSLLEDGTLDACLLSGADVVWEKTSLSTTFFSIKIHPSELVPIPGEGTLAFISYKENIALRRLIKTIHSTETALCTNVERRLLKRFENNTSGIGAYCYRDSAGFFHAHAFMEGRKEKGIHVSCSQSTHLELDTRLYDLLIQKAQH